jgi:pimeloyl-ACP methyl ester carboxylesterase
MTAPENSEAQPGSYVRANGLDIYYEEHGQKQGQPLVLIHGGAISGASWQPYLAAFAEHYRVIMPDSRGHGKTFNPAGTLSYRLMADDVAAFAHELGLQKPLIYGYSDGGQIALEIGMHYPDLAQVLVIAGAYIKLSEGGREFARSIMGDEESPEVDTEKFERENPDLAGLLRPFHDPENWKTVLKQLKPVWNAPLDYTPAELAQIVVPALVLLADRDDFIPVEEAVKMYRLLPTSELAIVPGSDHIDLVLSPAKVALVQPLILDFFQRHGSKVD